MSFEIRLPGGHRLDILDGQSTAVQRALRRTGIAGFEAPTMAAFLASIEGIAGPPTVFDVGANIGLYASTAKKLHPAARVVAFEPTPETAKICAAITRANGLDVRVEQCALGSVVGRGTLFLSETSDSSNSLVEGFKRAVGTVEVPVSTIDAFVDASGVAPDLIKIDAEGYEAEILRGARRTLETHHPLLILEVLFRRGNDHGPEIGEALEGLGYSGSRISTDTNWDSPAVVAGDPKGVDRDWLLYHAPLDGEFSDRFDRLLAALVSCTADHNRQVLAPTHDPSRQSDDIRRSFAVRAERGLVELRSRVQRAVAAITRKKA